MDKPALRKHFRTLRNQISEKESKSLQILTFLRDEPGYSTAHTILFYVSRQEEAATHPLIQTELTEGQRQIVVPSVLSASSTSPASLTGGNGRWSSVDESALKLFELRSFSELVTGAFGILELDSRLQSEREIAPENIDLVILPGVAFDRRGQRLGYGKGHYDRLLPSIRPDALRIGLAFHCQVTEALPAEPHDQCVDLVITDREIIHTGARSR